MHAVKNNERYLRAAKAVKNDLMQAHWNGKQLARVVGKKGRLGHGGLEDYAYVARGLLDFARLTGEKRDWQDAGRIIHQAWQRFYKQDGWLLAENMLLRYGAGQAAIADGAMPSTSGVLIQATRGYVKHQPDTGLEQRALLALSSGHQLIRQEPFWYASHIGLMFGK